MSSDSLRIWLVRHGETGHNASGRFLGATDIDLSERGLEQARALAGLFEGRPLSALYSSPLRRARQTAEPIGLACDLPVRPLPALAELHHGELEGLPYAELPRRFPELVQAWITDPADAAIPGGETLRQLRERAWPAVEQIAAEAKGEVCVVSHKMALLTVVGAAIGLEVRHSLRMELDLASVSALDLRPGRGWRLVALNGTHHLAAAGAP